MKQSVKSPNEHGELWGIREHTLEDLEVLKVCVFGIDIEFHFRHRHVLCGTLAAYSNRAYKELTKDAVVDLT